MADGTMPPLPENGAHKSEFMLKLNSDRVSELESALERNWIAHLILAGIGLALVLPMGRFRDLLASYVVHGTYDQTAFAIVLLAVLLYYFMKLGHLLTLYAEASHVQQDLLQSYLGKPVDDHVKKLVRPKSTNFYAEAFLGKKPFRENNTYLPYLVVTQIIVALAQAAPLYLVMQAFGLKWWVPCLVLASDACWVIYRVFVRKRRLPEALAIAIATVLLFINLIACFKSGWASLIVVVAGVLMLILYMQFELANRNLPLTRWVVASGPILTVAWLISFALIGAFSGHVLTTHEPGALDY
jgi:hypothetical protein